MSGGNCPETPRQKMIGMMYLMLTAMLALNVSGDLLKAFTLVDDSIKKQTESTDEKLGVSFNNFDAKAAQNPNRVKPKYEIALDVKAKADSVYNLIQSYKAEIINRADGISVEEAMDPAYKVINVSDQDKAAQVMMVEENGARYKALKAAMASFRDNMLNVCKGDSTMPADSGLNRAIVAMLATEDGYNSESHEAVTWESQMFEHLPIAASMGLMSAMQSNVRNVETDVVNYLYKSIDAASFKFNVLVPLVIPESQYVIQGGQYKADIMLAAYDDTMEPIVSVGGQELKVEGGKGKYVASAAGVGMKSYQAKLQIPDPVTGKLLDYFVDAKYEVGAPSLVVSATKMNAMYRGLNNPIEVSVAGVSPSDLQVSVQGGASSKVSASEYNVKPSAAKEVTVSVSSNAGGHSQSFGSKKFRVYDVPDPVVSVVGAKNGNIKSSQAASMEVVAELKDFVFDVSFKIKSFDISTTKQGFFMTEKGESSKLNAKQLALVKGVSRNGKIFVEKVVAVGPDGRDRHLNGVTLTVQ